MASPRVKSTGVTDDMKWGEWGKVTKNNDENKKIGTKWLKRETRGPKTYTNLLKRDERWPRRSQSEIHKTVTTKRRKWPKNGCKMRKKDKHGLVCSRCVSCGVGGQSSHALVNNQVMATAVKPVWVCFSAPVCCFLTHLKYCELLFLQPPLHRFLLELPGLMWPAPRSGERPLQRAPHHRRLFTQRVTSRGRFPRIAAGVGGCRAGRVWPRLPERAPICWRHPARLCLGRALLLRLWDF